MSYSSIRVAAFFAIGLTSLGVFVATQRRRNRCRNAEFHFVTPSPLSALLPYLSQNEISKLPYRPDSFPGGRDVETPYGSCRVYEFGPEDGYKVLFVHGISTPCVGLRRLAHKLVEKGYRVMLFDLFGRGYSDNPHPIHHRHSAHLYTTQLLSVLASSPLSWTGTSAFALIGYSLGGGIAASFTSHFPNLVSSLVLIAPGGLVREKHIAWQSYVLYQTEGILPRGLIRWLVKRRLRTPPDDEDLHNEEGVEEQLGVEEVVSAEAGAIKSTSSVEEAAATRLVNRVVAWQLENHDGFVDAFISSIRHAPITKQHADWAKIGQRLAAQRALETSKLKEENEEVVRNGLNGGKVVLVLGATDPIVIRDEIEADVKATVGQDGVHTIVLDAGHDLPVTKPGELAEELGKVWKEWGVL